MIFIKAYEALAPCQRRHHTEMKDPPVSEPELQTGTTSSLATISGYCSPIKKKNQHKNKLRKKILQTYSDTHKKRQTSYPGAYSCSKYCEAAVKANIPHSLTKKNLSTNISILVEVLESL